MRRLVAEEDDAGDEAVDKVMRHEPGEPFLERAAPALVSLDRSGEADQTHVDREIRQTGGDAGNDRQHPAGITLDVEEVQ